jgi:hypothetical protein
MFIVRRVILPLVFNLIHHWAGAPRRQEVSWNRVMWYANICSAGVVVTYGALEAGRHDERHRDPGPAHYPTD